MAKSSWPIHVQTILGPAVASSRLNGFDFMPLGGDSNITLLPLLFTVLVLVPRVGVLWKTPSKARPSWLFALKFAAFTLYIILQTVLLALLVAYPNAPSTEHALPVTVTVVVIVSYIWLLYASYLEHIRSVRPSTILCLYFGVSSLLDLASPNIVFFTPSYHVVAHIPLVIYLVKLVLLAAEVTEKRKLLLMPQWRNTSPEAAASIYSRVLFVWLNPLFLKGYRTLLTVNTLTPLDQDILSASRPIKLQERWRKADKSSKTALLWTFVCYYKWHLLAGVLPRLAYIGFAFAEPFLVQRVLDFTAESDIVPTRNFGYGLIASYALIHIGKAMSLAWYEHMTYRVLTMFRGSLITFVFGKTLRLSASAVNDAEAITLMSADIDRIGLCMPILHDAYASLVELTLSLWFLYRLLGIAVVPPTVFIVGKSSPSCNWNRPNTANPSSVCLAVGIPIAAAAGDAQVPWLEAIEKRLAVTSKTLGAIKAIRMAGLTETIHTIVSGLRIKEIRASRLFRLFSVIETGAANCTFTFAPVLGLGTFIILAKVNNTATLTEGVAFAVLGLFQLQDRPVMSLLRGFEDFQTIVNAFYRVQTYVLSAERQDYRITPLVPQSIDSELLDHGDQTKLSSAISVKDAAAGYSGGIILNDINFDIARGKITMIVGPVGSGKSTLLRLLLGELPEVSGSVISDYAKCAFAPQSPWITWGTVRSNILGMSAWDAEWYNTVIRACSLDTDLQVLPDGDQTRTGTRGSRLSGGQQMRVSLARALYSRSPLIILDDVFTGLDRTTEASILEAIFDAGGILNKIKSTVVLATNSASHLRFADHIIVLNKQGSIAEQGTLEQVSKSGGYVQHPASPPAAVDMSQKKLLELPEEIYHELHLSNQEDELAPGRQTSDLQLFTYYIRVAGGWTFSIYLLVCVAYTLGLSFPSIWVQWWTGYNAKHPNENLGYWLGVYFGVAALAVVGCMASDWAFRMLLVPKTSQRFHQLLLDTTMRATTSFLTSTNAGSTTNRFSQDLQLIDSDLPQALDETVMNLLGVIISAVLVFTGSGYAAAAIPVCTALLFLIQMFYLRTSRQLRFLDIEAKAPLFSHFIETLGGVTCIRAYGWSTEYMERSYHALDTSQKPYYLLWCIQRWLTLVLDLLAGGIAVMLVALATMMRNASTGFLGVALFSVINFGALLQTTVTQWTQLETALGAISRIQTFVEDTKSENLDGQVEESLPDIWPSAGSIVFDNVSASYQASAKPVIDGFNLTIQPGEKIALCGRTGSGKSSLVSTLVRMLELDAGSITIDGHDISKVPREDVRKRLNTLPQEPFFLHGSVRENIDPLQLSTDERIIETLRLVQLWDMLDSCGGLDAPLSQDALSHGQRQLFCLARAIARPGNIVIIDEATSSVDSETGQLMERVLREELQGRTLIAVAHKLHTVLDFDRIVLMDKGKMIESGNPQDLLATPTSAFYKLYTGTSSTIE
ncbi:ABC transporter [Trichoderma austrokoningii]